MNLGLTHSKIYFQEWKFILATIVNNYNHFVTSPWLVVKKLWNNNVFNDDTYNYQAASSKIKKFLKSSKKGINKNNVTCIDYFNGDLNLLLARLRKSNLERINYSSVLRINKKGLKTLDKIMSLKTPNPGKIFIVHDFPKPYDSVMPWDLMFASSKDHKEYGIKEGIYLHIYRQFPLFWEFLLLHEYVHHAIRSNMKKTKATGYKWIEEGLADWFALNAHYKLFRDWDFLVFVKNMYYIYEKVFPRSPLAEYAQYGKVITRIYLQGGHQAVGNILKAYLLNPDSKKWNDLYKDVINEKKSSYDQYRPLHLKTNFDRFLITLHEKADTINVPTLEYKILKILQRKHNHINKNYGLSQVKASVGDIKKAISNLMNLGFIIDHQKKYILNDSTIYLLRSNSIRPI